MISKISEMNIVGSIFIYSLVATMLLPYRLLALELRRSDCWKQFRHYQKTLQKCENNLLRIDFLKNCKKAELIPKFLKFRIPNNGCFDDKAIHEFQKNLLNKEIIRAKENYKSLLSNLIVIELN